MVIIPINKNSKHFERTFNTFIYRYGYQPIEGDDEHVIACVEEVKIRYKKDTIKKHIEDYCNSCNIAFEWNEKDFGF